MSYRAVIPNYLTWLRVFLIPIIVLLMSSGCKCSAKAALIVFFVAAISDFLDGYLARLWKVESDFGRVMDPVADKVLVAAILIMLTAEHFISAIPVVLIIGREILIGGIRESLASRNFIIPVSWVGKLKTTMQLIAIALLLAARAEKNLKLVEIIGKFTLWLAVILAILSAASYILAIVKELRAKKYGRQ